MKFLSHVEPSHRVLLVPMLASFVLFGLNLTVPGATLPMILQQFRWDYTTTALVFSASAVGYFVSTFLCGILIRRLGPRTVIVGGLLIQAAGLATFGSTSLAVLNAALQFLVGFGGGGTEVVVNYGIVRMERSGQSRLMNFTHAGFAFGAIFSPLVVGGLLAAGAAWPLMYRLMAGASLLMAAVLTAMPFHRLHAATQQKADEPSVLSLLRHPLLILCFFILLVYVGVEIGVCVWMAEYYVSVLHSPAWVGALMISVFWIGLLAGRLGVSVRYHNTSQEKLLLVLGAVCTVALLGAALAGEAWPAGAGFFLTGLGYSAIYPVVMALVGKHFPRGQSVAVGVAGTGGGIGALLIPCLMAAVADRIGLRRGFFIYVALNLVMLALIAVAAALTARMDRAAAGSSEALG